MEKKILGEYLNALTEVLGLNKKENNIKTYLKNIEFLLKCFSNFDFQKSKKESIMIYNCCSTLIGASLGDSMGSYCEFNAPNKSNCEDIWTDINPIFGTSRGQLTDDTEMATSMALGILESLHNFGSDYSNPSFDLRIQFIALYYLFWFETGPFDIGITTRKALHIENLDRFLKKDLKDESIISQMHDNSRQCNNNSLSNGFLMRHIPMSVLLYYIFEMNGQESGANNFRKLLEEKRYDELFISFIGFIEKEILLTHSNFECVVAAAIYDFLILSILKNNTEYVFLKKQEFVFDSNYYIELLKEFLGNLLKSNIEKVIKSEQYIQKILHSLETIDKMNNFEEDSTTSDLLRVGTNNVGYYMHAVNLLFFIIKFYPEFIKKEESGTYRNIIDFICNKGGDTDTNCCIVGAVFGAIVGVKNMENKYLEPHLKFNPDNQKNIIWRPFIYAPSILTLYGIKLFSTLNKQGMQSNQILESKDPSFEMIEKILTMDLESEANKSIELVTISELI